MDANIVRDVGIAALTSASRLPTSVRAGDTGRLNNVAREFEEVFLAQMLQPMLSAFTPEEPFGGGPGEEIWQSMLVKEYGKALVARGGIGIADAVMREVLLAQEAAARSHEKELPR